MDKEWKLEPNLKVDRWDLYKYDKARTLTGIAYIRGEPLPAPMRWLLIAEDIDKANAADYIYHQNNGPMYLDKEGNECEG